MFDPCLLVMQPRNIQPSLESYKKSFDIPMVFFKAFTEPQVTLQLNKYIKEHDYTHYIIIGDDAIVTRQAAETVLEYTEDEIYDVFTGWMNMHTESDGTFSVESTVNHNKIRCADPSWGPSKEDYGEWVTMDQMRKLPPEPIRTSYANFALTGMTKEMWERFPVACWPNSKSSDHHLSLRLQGAGKKVWTHPDAFIRHLRRGWSSLSDHWLVGNVSPEIIECMN
jgi:hypothetical protein|tara:strand:- start:761 stop:1432 length:672 start_codon:yes stop_codon:yes gene_type:complete